MKFSRDRLHTIRWKNPWPSIRTPSLCLWKRTPLPQPSPISRLIGIC